MSTNSISSSDARVFDLSLPRDISNGEIGNGEQIEIGMTGNGEQENDTTGSGDELEDDNSRSFSTHHDKYQAAVAIQSRPNIRGIEHGELLDSQQNPVKDLSSKLTNPVDGFMDAEFGNFSEQDHVIGGKTSKINRAVNMISRKIFLGTKSIRRILNFKESIFKYGVMIPKNDHEADSAPEAKRWASGRELEWLRLQDQGTFERKWDWTKVQERFPAYQKKDVGHVFFVYDYKHSGEHRVRLVFDGSKQNPETYTETYAPTVRGESVRLFHIYGVEESYHIAQYGVPQAFLKSVIDCTLFVYPPRGYSEYQGQLLKLRLSLYGAKQSAALWNTMIDAFLKELGFTPSPMDPCFYKRSDALVILFCDDLRVAAAMPVLKKIHDALFTKFAITTSDGTRFLGMDTVYNLKEGY